MSYRDHAFAVILAGGGGTRLWPKSRNATPKQFLKLTSNKTMVQVAGERMTKVLPWERVIVVTNNLYINEIREQLPQVPPENIIAEPEKRDTALAMLIGTLYAKSKDPEAIVMNGASDHVITDEQEFVRVMEAALQIAAEKQQLVTVGIIPTRPETGFGYIKAGDHVRKMNDGLFVFHVESFTEKPNLANARAFISTGNYFWNANMYVWSVSALEEAFRKYMPDLLELTKDLPALSPKGFHDALPAIYKPAKTISIDYAISEKADNLVLIPGDFGWNDVGDWKVVYDLNKKNRDEQGNVLIGESDVKQTTLYQANNNLIHTSGRLIAMAGVDDMIVVDTDEILLIVPKNRSQDVKKIVEQLKAEGKKEYL